MTPIKFPQQNIVFAENQPEYLPLPAHVTQDGQQVTACWGLTWRERFRVLLTGRVYVTLLMFGRPLTPSIVSTQFIDRLAKSEGVIRKYQGGAWTK